MLSEDLFTDTLTGNALDTTCLGYENNNLGMSNMQPGVISLDGPMVDFDLPTEYYVGIENRGRMTFLQIFL